MFGLLGGLMGRGIARSFAARPAFAGRPLAGLLAGRAVKQAINPRQARPSSLSGGRAPDQTEQGEDAQAPQQAPVEEMQSPQPQQQASQPPAPQPQIEKTATELREVAQERQQTTQDPQQQPEDRPVTAGLLDEAPAVQTPQPPQSEDKVAPPQQVVNQTDVLTPVAMAEESQFPNVPQLNLSGLIDRVGDIPPRRIMAAEDPVPLKQADVKSQARHTANRPDMSFGLASTATSYTPNYSYRRA